MQVSVQGSMGEGALAGIPLQLAGTRKILEFMDWGTDGAMGNFINIGSIGTDLEILLKPLEYKRLIICLFWCCTGGNEVDEADDIFILVAPQNAMGNCIIDVNSKHPISRGGKMGGLGYGSGLRSR